MSDEKEPIVGIVSFANGEEFSYTDPEEYLRVIKEELPYHPTTGFRYKTLTDDPDIRNGASGDIALFKKLSNINGFRASEQ